MAWTAPLTWAAQNLTAALLNTHLRDNLNETAPGIATAGGRFIVTDGANSIVERLPAQTTVNSSESTTSETYTALATAGPAVTVTTGTTALVYASAQLWNASTNGVAFMGVAVSGASTVASADTTALAIDYTTSDVVAPSMTRTFLFTGLTAGSNTFTCEYRTNAAAGAANFKNRNLIVIPL